MEVVASVLCYNSELLPRPLVIEEANWLTLDKDVPAGGGFDAVICLGNSFAHLPDSKGKLVALAAALVLFSAGTWEGGGRKRGAGAQADGVCGPAWHPGDQSEHRLALKNIASMVRPGGLLVIDHRNYDYILSTGCAPPGKNIYYKVGLVPNGTGAGEVPWWTNGS